jgi:hypothetical protein
VPPAVEVSPTVWLVDVSAGTSITLLESNSRIADAWFDEAGNAVVRQWSDGTATDTTYDLAGVERSRDAPDPYRCVTLPNGAIEVDGRPFADLPCGLVSPDGRWMLYAIDAEPVAVTDDYEVPAWDQWLINLNTGDRMLLHERMRHCGGCDGRFGPEWAADSRFVFFSELYAPGDVFLTNTSTLETRAIGSAGGATDITQKPVWSASGSRLLHPGPEGSAILEDLATGETLDLGDLPWPAAFDPTGRYVYSPAARFNPADPTEVTIVDLSTLEVVATLPGLIDSLLIWGAGGPPVIGVDGGFVASLQKTPNCRGTVVYRAGEAHEICVEDGYGAVFSPDASRVAIAVQRELVSLSYLDLGGPAWRTDIVVVDLATGDLRTVAEAAYSSQPPDITWNEAGTHILVRWPASYGI